VAVEERAVAIALLRLERESGDSRDEWRLLAEKGRDWLESAPGGADTWRELAEGLWARRP
jgi:hypothetical protein